MSGFDWLYRVYCSVAPMTPPRVEPPEELRYGGENGGPLVSEVTSPIERVIREAIDHFDSVHLVGRENWLMRQRTGRLCEDIIRAVEMSMPAEVAALRAERDAAVVRAEALADALTHFYPYTGCPVCSGDCHSANPPVMDCPMLKAEAALTAYRAASPESKP